MNKLTEQLAVNGRPITGFTGGGATALDGIATVSMPVGVRGFIVVSGEVYFYELQAGTADESPPDIIRPYDYATTTNEKIWVLVHVNTGSVPTPGGFTASRAIVSDGAGDLAVATTTSTEIGYVNGVTSAIQTQINARAALQQYRTVYIDAGAMVPRTTGGAAAATEETSTHKVTVDTFLFDGTTIEYVQFKLVPPDDWDRGTIKAKFFWGAATSGSGGIALEIAAVAVSDDDAIDVAFGTKQTVTDTVIAVGDMHVTAATAAITVGGSPALGDVLLFQVNRDPTHGSDTMTQDLKLYGVQLQYRTLTTEAAAW